MILISGHLDNYIEDRNLKYLLTSPENILEVKKLQYLLEREIASKSVLKI